MVDHVDVVLVVDRAATPDEAVALDGLEGRDGPRLPLDGHNVHVSVEEERRRLASEVDRVAADMKLLGIHVIGEQASELIHVGLACLLMDAGWDLFNRICFNYPTLGVMYQRAAYVAAAEARLRMLTP